MLAIEDQNPPIDKVLDAADKFCENLFNIKSLIQSNSSHNTRSEIPRETRRLLFARWHVAQPIFDAVIATLSNLQTRLGEARRDRSAVLGVENVLGQLSLELADAGL